MIHYDDQFVTTCIEQPHFFECFSSASVCAYPTEVTSTYIRDTRSLLDRLNVNGTHGLYNIQLVVYKQIVLDEESVDSVYVFTYMPTCMMLGHLSNGSIDMLRVHNQKRMQVLVHGERVGVTYTFHGLAMRSFVTNLCVLSSPRYTMRIPHLSDKTKNLLFERVVFLNYDDLSNYHQSICIRYPRILFLFGFNEQYRLYHRLIENSYVGFDVRFLCASNNMYYCRKVISYHGAPIV